MLPVSTSIMQCVTRIEALVDGAVVSIGTGFFYHFKNVLAADMTLPVLVTNKHVIESASEIRLSLLIIPLDHEIRSDGFVLGERSWSVLISLRDIVVYHPDSEVDLCIILVGNLLNSLPEGMCLKAAFLDSSWMLDQLKASMLSPIEPLVMAGYPNGLWDEVNNRPILRRGSTASHPLVNWNGRREFVLDIAVFQGSSGSPVFLFEDGLCRTDVNAFAPGTQAFLVGILYAGPVLEANGKLVPQPLPSSVDKIPQLRLMMNLGLAIHADVLNEFPDIIRGICAGTCN